MFKELLKKCEESLEPNCEYDSYFIFTDDYKLNIISIVGTIVVDLFNETIELIPR